MRADLDAGVALYAFVFIPDDFSVFIEVQCLNRAVFHACAAVHAHVDRFGIMTKKTIEGASLKKDGGPIGRTVNI